jgi:hypothetical protein
MTIITDTLIELDNRINAASSLSARLPLLKEKEIVTKLALDSTGLVHYNTAVNADMAGAIPAPGTGLAIYINRYVCSYKNDLFGAPCNRQFTLASGSEILSKTQFNEYTKTIELGILCAENTPVVYSFPDVVGMDCTSTVSIVYTILSPNPEFTAIGYSVVY